MTSNSKHMISFQKSIENRCVLNSYYTPDPLKSKGRLFLQSMLEYAVLRFSGRSQKRVWERKQ